MYNEEKITPAPEQRKYNGDYAFPFISAESESHAGAVIVRGGLVGVSQRITPAGEEGAAEIHGTNTMSDISLK